MRKLIFILFAIFLFSCEKENRLPCEINQTFTLIFKNYNHRVSSLFISGNKYDVKSSTGDIYFTVPVKDAEAIHVLYKISYKGKDTKTYYKDTVSCMLGKPNICGKYYYYF